MIVRPSARSRSRLRTAAGAIVVLAVAIVAPPPAAAGPTSPPTSAVREDSAAGDEQAAPRKAKHACELLTSAEIESVLAGAPLDPGPRKRKIPNARRTFTSCAWDDELARDEPQLAVFTGLLRKARPRDLRALGVPIEGTGTRALTPDERAGLGERGTVEILRDGTYGNVAVVDGRQAFFVSAQYQGAGALPVVTEDQMLALARLAAARVSPTR